jgi:hypothetical protein
MLLGIVGYLLSDLDRFMCARLILHTLQLTQNIKWMPVLGLYKSVTITASGIVITS